MWKHTCIALVWLFLASLGLAQEKQAEQQGKKLPKANPEEALKLTNYLLKVKWFPMREDLKNLKELVDAFRIDRDRMMVQLKKRMSIVVVGKEEAWGATITDAQKKYGIIFFRTKYQTVNADGIRMNVVCYYAHCTGIFPDRPIAIFRRCDWEIPYLQFISSDWRVMFSSKPKPQAK